MRRPATTGSRGFGPPLPTPGRYGLRDTGATIRAVTVGTVAIWGRYIGYYGGVNYGNGYVGRGYYGGYWNRNQFNYNRQVTNVNITVIHNTYITNVTNITTYNRVSYSGGRGGVNLAPNRGGSGRLAPAALAAVEPCSSRTRQQPARTAPNSLP